MLSVEATLPTDAQLTLDKLAQHEVRSTPGQQQQETAELISTRADLNKQVQPDKRQQLQQQHQHQQPARQVNPAPKKPSVMAGFLRKLSLGSGAGQQHKTDVDHRRATAALPSSSSAVTGTGCTAVSTPAQVHGTGIYQQLSLAAAAAVARIHVAKSPAHQQHQQAVVATDSSSSSRGGALLGLQFKPECPAVSLPAADISWVHPGPAAINEAALPGHQQQQQQQPYEQLMLHSPRPALVRSHTTDAVAAAATAPAPAAAAAADSLAHRPQLPTKTCWQAQPDELLTGHFPAGSLSRCAAAGITVQVAGCLLPAEGNSSHETSADDTQKKQKLPHHLQLDDSADSSSDDETDYVLTQRLKALELKWQSIPTVDGAQLQAGEAGMTTCHEPQ
jgi:hypothetical protein